MYVSSSLHSVRFGQLLCCAHPIVDIMKVYIERNSMHVDLIRLRKQILALLTLETSKWILSQPTCLRMESRSILATSNYNLLLFLHSFSSICVP